MATIAIVLTLFAALVLSSVLIPMLYVNRRLRAENQGLSEALDCAMARIAELETAAIGELKREPSSGPRGLATSVDQLATVECSDLCAVG